MTRAGIPKNVQQSHKFHLQMQMNVEWKRNASGSELRARKLSLFPWQFIGFCDFLENAFGISPTKLLKCIFTQLQIFSHFSSVSPSKPISSLIILTLSFQLPLKNSARKLINHKRKVNHKSLLLLCIPRVLRREKWKYRRGWKFPSLFIGIYWHEKLHLKAFSVERFCEDVSGTHTTCIIMWRTLKGLSKEETFDCLR